MPLLRILLLAIVLWIAFRLIRRIIGPAKTERPKQVDYEDMVTCAHCGVHLPRSQAITESGKTFCNEQHARAHERQ